LRFSITITKTLEDPEGAGAADGVSTTSGEETGLGLAFAVVTAFAAEGPPQAATRNRHTVTVRLRITSNTLRSEPLEIA
jgi:hypothetical protein